MRVRLIAFLVLAVLLGALSGCGVNFTKYTSAEGLRVPMQIPYKVVVNIDTDKLTRYLNNEKNIRQIKEAVTQDIEDNIFSFSQTGNAYKIVVNVDIRELQYNEAPWGFLWYPLMFLGAPIAKATGTAEVRVTFFHNDGSVLETYNSETKLTNWYGLYYRLKSSIGGGDGGNAKLALRRAMEDIKQQIDTNRYKLLAEIRKKDAYQSGSPINAESLVTPTESQEEPAPIVTLPLADVDRNIPRGRVEYRDAVAVVIGNRDYTCTDVPAVDYAINDASIIKQYVTDLLGYREGNVIYVENATGAELRSVFGSKQYPGRLANLMKEGSSDVFVYYSGHGAPDPNSKKGYFLPVDCCPNDVRLNGYPLAMFYENMGKLQPKSLTIVIDACFSGGSNHGNIIGQASPIGIEVVNRATVGDSCAVFTSSGNNEISSWYPEKSHGLFTYFFLKGLRGEADSNGDKKLTSQELYDYLADPTRGVPYYARSIYNGRVQTPTISGDSKMVLVEYQ